MALLCMATLTVLYMRCRGSTAHSTLKHRIRKVPQLETSNKKIMLCWVPSHVAVIGNERRKEAKRLACRIFDHLACLPHRDRYPIIKRRDYKRGTPNGKEHKRISCCKLKIA